MNACLYFQYGALEGCENTGLQRATCFVILFIWGAVWHFIPKSQLLTKDTCISIWILWDLQPLVRDRHPMKNTHSGLKSKGSRMPVWRLDKTGILCQFHQQLANLCQFTSFWFPHLDNGYIIPIFCEDTVKSDSRYPANAGSPFLSSHPHWGRPCDVKLSTLNYLDICKRGKMVTIKNKTRGRTFSLEKF